MHDVVWGPKAKQTTRRIGFWRGGSGVMHRAGVDAGLDGSRVSSDIEPVCSTYERVIYGIVQCSMLYAAQTSVLADVHVLRPHIEEGLRMDRVGVLAVDMTVP